MTGYSSSKWLPPSIIRVTACTGRTLWFLSRMVSKRHRSGYRGMVGLLKDEAETRNLWVSACWLASARMATQAHPGWVSERYWLASRISAPALCNWVSCRTWLVQVCLCGFYVFFCDVAFGACDVVECDAVCEVQCFRDLVDFGSCP